MRISTLQKTSDTPSSVRFAHSRGWGWVFVVAGVALAGAGLLDVVDDGRWVAVGIGTFFAWMGAVTVLQRFELELDMAARRYAWTRGMPWRLESGSGGLDEVEGVRLDQEWETRGSGNRRREVCTWEVRLLLPEPVGVTKVVDRTDEDAVRREAEDLARRLGRPLVDATGREPVTIYPDDLDRSLAERLGAGADDGAGRWDDPPPGSGIDVAVDAGHRTVLLPRRGFGGTEAVLVLFGLVFASAGATVAVAAWTAEPDPLPVVAFTSVFVLIGLGVSFAAVVAALDRTWIRDEGSVLVTGSRLFGWTFGERRLERGAIEAVEIVQSSSSRRRNPRLRIGGFGVAGPVGGAGTEVRIRTDDATVRLGRHLDEGAMDWLRDALTAMAAR